MGVAENFPNPFSTQTQIRWMQPAMGDVTVRMFDGSGRLVGEYAAGEREKGMQTMTIQAGTLSSGVYFYELRSGANVARGTMMVAR